MVVPGDHFHHDHVVIDFFNDIVDYGSIYPHRYPEL
jgi:hypothetical protein